MKYRHNVNTVEQERRKLTTVNDIGVLLRSRSLKVCDNG